MNLMKKYILILLLFFILTINTYPGLDFNFGVSSYYFWRGFDLNQSRELLINPYLNLIIGDTGFSVKGWGSFAFEEKEFREVNVTLTYAFKPISHLLVKVGITDYRFFNITDPFYPKTDSRECFVSLGLPWTPLQPEITAYYDFETGNGMYYQLKLEQVVPILKFIRLELHSTLGYNAGQWLPEGAAGGFSDFTFTGMLPVKLGRIFLIPYVSYTAVLLDSIGNGRYLWYGLSFGY